MCRPLDARVHPVLGIALFVNVCQTHNDKRWRLIQGLVASQRGLEYAQQVNRGSKTAHLCVFAGGAKHHSIVAERMWKGRGQVRRVRSQQEAKHLLTVLLCRNDIPKIRHGSLQCRKKCVRQNGVAPVGSVLLEHGSHSISQRVSAVCSRAPLGSHAITMKQTLEHRIGVTCISTIPKAGERILRWEVVQHWPGQERLNGHSHARKSRPLQRLPFSDLHTHNLLQAQQTSPAGDLSGET